MFQGVGVLLIVLGVPILLASAARFKTGFSGRSNDHLAPGGHVLHAEYLVPSAKSQVSSSGRDARPIAAPEELDTASSWVRRVEASDAANEQSASERAARNPLGILHVSGDVYVDDVRVPRETTIFTGDGVRVGPASAATLKAPNDVELVVRENTRLSFMSVAYSANLEQGTVNFHAPADVRDFEIKIGTFLVLPDPDSEDSAEIVRASDGSTVIKAYQGSVGIIAIEGADAVYIQAGQQAFVSKEGELLSPATSHLPTAGVPGGPSTGAKKKWVVSGLAASSAAAVVTVLATRSEGATSLSPSTP